MVERKTTSSGVEGTSGASANATPIAAHMVRVATLKAMQVANTWNDTELARHCGRAPQQVHAWFNNDRRIGEKLARSLELKLGLHRYALDGLQAPRETSKTALFDGATETPASAEGYPPAERTAKKPRDLPIISWGEIALMLDEEPAKLEHRPGQTLETFAPSSPRAKFVAMPDDSMAAEIQPGDHLLFDPTEAPRAGDIVLVRSGAEYFVRMFRPRTAYVFEAVALNENYQSLESGTDGLVVAGVMVEHRRYRRR